MIDIIENLEKRGFRISIYPVLDGEWMWTGGVYMGNDKKANWVDSNNGLPKARYHSYKEAFEAVINYCNEKENKQKRK